MESKTSNPALVRATRSAAPHLCRSLTHVPLIPIMSPLQVAASLSEVLVKNADEGVRTMSCVLLRQVAAARALWFSIPLEFQECVKKNLIQWCVRWRALAFLGGCPIWGCARFLWCPHPPSPGSPGAREPASPPFSHFVCVCVSPQPAV